MMTTLYLVRATHPAVPGEPTSIHFTRAAADAKALELVEAMFTDGLALNTKITSAMLRTEGEPAFEPANWQPYLRRLQIARIVECDDDYSPEEIEAQADEQSNPDEWLANEAELDVWIEKIDADMPLPRVLVQVDAGVVRSITVDRSPVDMLSIGDGQAISCPAMVTDDADMVNPMIEDIFTRYWQPVAPTIN